MKACVVGYGAVGPVHADAVKNIDGAELYAVCDTNAERAALCKERYGCLVYNDFDAMLANESIDVVHICTPHYLHGEMARRALAAGKHVVLEKPVVLTERELIELMELSERSEQKLCVILQNRRNASIEMMKRIIASEDTGRLLGMIGGVYWKRDEAYYAQDAWRGRWETEGGGAIINQSIHMIDMMIYFGGKIKKMSSAINHWQVSGIEVEDNAHALIDFESGAKGIFNATNCYIGDEPYMLELQFERSRYRYADGRLYRIDAKGAVVLAEDEKVMIGKSYWGSGHKSLIGDFYRAVRGEDAPYTTVRDAYETMKAAFAIYREAGVPCPNNAEDA